MSENATTNQTTSQTTKQMKRLLVALDGSPHAHKVLAAAVELARHTDGKLLLFRAVEVPVESTALAFSLPPGELETQMRTAAEATLADYLKEVPPDRLEGARVGIGSPWRAICDTATEADVDLIVVGSQGYGTLDRILGTTASRVVNRADRSVLVVR
jgi:nucleotide-binding universal stress UspA family protein